MNCGRFAEEGRDIRWNILRVQDTCPVAEGLKASSGRQPVGQCRVRLESQEQLEVDLVIGENNKWTLGRSNRSDQELASSLLWGDFTSSQPAIPALHAIITGREGPAVAANPLSHILTTSVTPIINHPFTFLPTWVQPLACLYVVGRLPA